MPGTAGQLDLTGLLEASPSPPRDARPRQRRAPRVERPVTPGGSSGLPEALDLSGIVESAQARPPRSRPAAAPITPSTPRSPHSADDYLLDGDWSPARAEEVKGWFKQTYSRDLPHRFGQTATHDRMGLDHSQNMDVQVSPQSDEGRALAAYLRQSRIPFLAYNRAKPGAATGPHFHIGRPSRGFGSASRDGSALNLDGVLEPLNLDGLLEGAPGEEDDVVRTEATVDRVTGKALSLTDERRQLPVDATTAQVQSRPLPPLRRRETFDPTTEEGRRKRDERTQLERTPGALLEVAVPLPAEERFSDVEAGAEMVRSAYVRALVARGVPEPQAVKLVGPGYSLRDARGAVIAPADAISEDSFDEAARALRVRLDPNHVSKLVDDYRAGRGTLARVADWATDAERSPGEKALDVAAPVVRKAARGADLATRPLQAVDAAFWSKARGVDNVAALKAAYDQFFGENPALGRNLVAEALRDSDRLRAVNPRLPVLFGELANLVLQPSNLIPVGAVAKGGKLLRGGGEAGRAGRLLEGAGDVAREVGVLDRGLVNPRPLGLADGVGLADDVLETSGRAVAPVPEATETLRAQFNSAMDAASPRVGVLVTPGENPRRVPEGFAVVEVDEGTLYLSREKLKAAGLDSPQKLRDHIDREGFEGLIGKVSPVEDTSKGVALRTEDAAGRELSTSIVTDPEAARAQAAVDRAQFPEAARQELGSAREMVARREAQHVLATEPESPGTGRFVDEAGLRRKADEHGLTLEEVRAEAQRQGYRVEPDSAATPQTLNLDGVVEPASRTAAEVAENIRVTHARERADFYSREAARTKDPVQRAEAERLASEYSDEAAEARVSDVADRVKRGEQVAPEEMADLERAVLAEDGKPVYIEVDLPASTAAASASAAPKTAARRALDATLDVADATKSTFASADLSAAGRQAFLPFLFDSRATLGGLARGVGAATPAGQSRFARWLDSHPRAGQWRDFGLELDTLTGAPNEFFTSKLAERIPVYGPGVIKPSDRVMTAQLDAVRLAVADSWGDDLLKAGLTPESAPEEWRAVAKFINTASGRGELGRVGQAIYPVTRRIIFSPSLLKSRFQVLSPLTYARMPPATRKIAAKKLGKAAAKMAPVLGLAYLTADSVGLNPFRGDFGLARYGDTTYDLTGGLGGKLKFVFQLAQSAGHTANAYRKGEEVEYKDTPWGIGLHFLRSQLAPSYSIIPDAVTGETFDKQEFTWTEGALRRLTPGFAQDVYEGFTEGDGVTGSLKALPSFIGVSSRTRNREELKRQWEEARAASRKAQASAQTADVMKDAPTEVRDELVRLRVSLSEADAGLTREIAAAVERARSGPSWSRLTAAGRKKFLENVIAGVRKEMGAANAERTRRAAAAKEGERVSLTGAAAEGVKRLGIVIDPVFAGHKVGVMSGESVGFKGQHAGLSPEQLDEYRRELTRETQAEVERVMAFEGFNSQSDAVKRNALQGAVDRVKTREHGPLHYQTRRKTYEETQRLEHFQRELEGRFPQPKPGQPVKLGEEGSGPVSRVEPAHEEIRRAVDKAKPGAEPTFRPFPDGMGDLNIPRASMPQIKSEHRGAMVQFLKGRGIAHTQGEIAPSGLKPSQADWSPEKVKKALGFTGTDRSLLISQDGHVADGHHQWLAKLVKDSEAPIPVIRLDAPIQQLLLEMARFPSSGVDDASA